MLSFILLPLGCGACGDMAPLQTAALAGDTAGLQRFAGRWLDENGNLIAVISSPPGARLSIRSPKELEPKDARLQNGQIVFHLGGGDLISLRLAGEDELLVSVARETPDELSPSSCSCGGPFPALALVRNPTPAWLMKQASGRITEVTAHFARKAYDGAWDWLARAL